jgi:ATP-dependent DNA ligase
LYDNNSTRHTAGVTLPTFAPMLASTQPPRDAAEWLFEPKLDGWRALVYVDGEVRVRTRTGRDISDRLPNLRGLAEPGRRLVLDGELVADAGRSGELLRLGPHLRTPRQRDITFVAFDILVFGDEDF